MVTRLVQNSVCSSLKGSQFIFSAVWWKHSNDITFPWDFTLYFVCSYSLADLEKSCPVAFRKMNKHSCMFLWRCSIQPAHSSKRKHLLGVSGVLCIYLVSYCFKQMPFSLIGVISIAAGPHRGCLASPRINKGTLCKWPLQTMAGPLIGFHGAGSGQCSTSHGPIYFH